MSTRTLHPKTWTDHPFIKPRARTSHGSQFVGRAKNRYLVTRFGSTGPFGQVGRDVRPLSGHDRPSYDWVDRGREISRSFVGFGRRMILVEGSGRTRDDAFLVGRCDRAQGTDCVALWIGDAFLFARCGRARLMVARLGWVDHGLLLPGSYACSAVH
ncbi:unnamed protein product [Microthlaspi erraticum]|uniref:Uncharacterized protein n=1 Tax=Microthlaspi erraticum TaxID=1685480 RepID=A0A6D2KSU4_9BRAS|nr:unnamed protein product [Microthlaspi erraticum]